MGHNNAVIDTDLAEANISHGLKKEIALFREIKPYLEYCLKVNHDLNNPLSGILGYTEFLLMEESALSEDNKNSVLQIVKCAERIRSIVETLSDHKIALAKKIDLREIIDDYDEI